MSSEARRNNFILSWNRIWKLSTGILYHVWWAKRKTTIGCRAKIIYKDTTEGLESKYRNRVILIPKELYSIIFCVRFYTSAPTYSRSSNKV